MSQRTQYIVGARNPASRQQDLQRFLDAVKQRGDATVTSGDTTKHLVVDMADEAASALQAQLGKDVIIEKNLPLQL
jgi:hypothetical protein